MKFRVGAVILNNEAMLPISLYPYKYIFTVPVPIEQARLGLS